MNSRKMSGSFEYNSPHVVAENFQEGLIVLNLDSGKYFEVGERLVPLLDALLSGVSIESLKKGVDGREAGAGSAIDAAITLMLEEDLLRAAPVTVRDAEDQVCADILAAGSAFSIICHDDMAELIAADPIHDIDPDSGRVRA